MQIKKWCELQSLFKLEVTLLNIISFNKGTIDLDPDERLTTSDIIFLTETQLQLSDESQSILSLQEF